MYEINSGRDPSEESNSSARQFGQAVLERIGELQMAGPHDFSPPHQRGSDEKWAEYLSPPFKDNLDIDKGLIRLTMMRGDGMFDTVPHYVGASLLQEVDVGFVSMAQEYAWDGINFPEVVSDRLTFSLRGVRRSRMPARRADQKIPSVVVRDRQLTEPGIGQLCKAVAAIRPRGGVFGKSVFSPPFQASAQEIGIAMYTLREALLEPSDSEGNLYGGKLYLATLRRRLQEFDSQWPQGIRL